MAALLGSMTDLECRKLLYFAFIAILLDSFNYQGTDECVLIPVVQKSDRPPKESCEDLDCKSVNVSVLFVCAMKPRVCAVLGGLSPCF